MYEIVRRVGTSVALLMAILVLPVQAQNWPTRAECSLYEVALNARDSGERTVLSVQAVTDCFPSQFHSPAL